MAEKLGYQLTAPQAGIDNPYLSNGVYQVTNKWFPYSHSLAEPSLSGAIVRNNSNKPNRVINGALITSYSDDYYHRVHVKPNNLDLGNVVSSQEVSLYVWNAHFTKKRLNAITGVSQGIILEGQTAPYTFQALEEQAYKVTVTPDGSSTIDDQITWDFNDETPSITLTGDRIVAFSFMPDWRDGVTERLEWSTDILVSETGVEQRSSLYVAPRRYLNASFYVYENERQLFNNMASWHAKNWALPLWFYSQQIKQSLTVGDTLIYCDTSHIEFKVGGLAFLYQDAFSYEIAEITAIEATHLVLKRPLQNTWSKGTRLYPAITAIFSNVPSLKRKTDTLQETTIEFRASEVSTFTKQAPVVIYKGYPVFTLRPEESDDLSSEYQQILSIFDNKMALPRVTDTAGNRFYVHSYRWLALGREARSQYRSLLYYLNGQQKAMWIPTHAQDLTVVDRISATEAILIINQCGYSRFALGDSDKKYLYIRLTDGTVFYREVLNSTNEGKTERLLLNEPLYLELQPNQIVYISFMRLCRLSNDSVEIKHIADTEGVATSQLTFKRVIDNEL